MGVLEKACEEVGSLSSRLLILIIEMDLLFVEYVTGGWGSREDRDFVPLKERETLESSPKSPKQEVSSENDSSEKESEPEALPKDESSDEESEPEDVLTRIFGQVATADQVPKEVAELKDAPPELEDGGQATVDELVEVNLEIKNPGQPTPFPHPHCLLTWDRFRFFCRCKSWYSVGGQ